MPKKDCTAYPIDTKGDRLCIAKVCSPEQHVAYIREEDEINMFNTAI